MSVSVGLDIGGTKTLAVALAADGSVVAETRIETSQDRDLLLTSVRSVIEGMSQDGPVGIGIPGTVRRQREIVNAPNLPCLNGMTSADLTKALGRDVVIGNDAKCAALAEWKFGAGAGVGHFVLVAVGTGIGVGIVSKGELVLGSSGLAGEFGHMIVDQNGPECSCGQRGCWERLASGATLTRVAQRGFREGWLPANQKTGKVRGEDLIDASRRRVPEAAEALDEFARWISIGLINIINALDPDLIVLAGGISAASDVLVPRVDFWRDRQWNGFGERHAPPLVPASLGERAGALGAALLCG